LAAQKSSGFAAFEKADSHMLRKRSRDAFLASMNAMKFAEKQA
jgi:hypothetical protein